MDIEQIMAQMPRVEDSSRWGNMTKFRMGAEAQRRLLAEQGWRKVPSEDEIDVRLGDLEGTSRGYRAHRFHKWLMGEKDA